MATTFFCPFCGLSDQQDTPVCSRCGRSLEHWKEHSYEERLILTLRHPILEHRMMAIRILGERGYERAVPAFAEMVAAGYDVYTLREIALALTRINTLESRRLLANLKKHPSPVVRSVFAEMSGTIEGGRHP